MKKIFVFLVFCLLTELILGQDTELAIQEKVKQIDYELTETDSLTFVNAKPLFDDSAGKKLIPVSESDFIKDYPGIFIRSDKGYAFKALNNRTLKAISVENDSFKDRRDYEFKGRYCNFALIYIFGYEYWGYISVDLNDGIAFYTLDIPKTSDCKTAVSYSSYYSEEEIAIIDLETMKQIVITIDQWTTIDFKQADDGFYFMLRSVNPLDNKYKYVRITL
jgi:hypothetical protein